MAPLGRMAGHGGSSCSSAVPSYQDLPGYRLDLEPELSQRERQIAEDEAAQETKVQTAAGMDKLKKALEINRCLHAALVRKKLKAEELKQSIDKLEDRLERAQEVELPSRTSAVAELEELIRQEQQLMQEAKLQLGRGLMEREEKVEDLTQVAARLRELGVQNRTKLRDQQAQVKDQQREVREMRRHIQIMEGGDETPQNRSSGQSVCSDASELEAGPSSDGPSPRADSTASENVLARRRTALPQGSGARLLTINEINTLPGLDLHSLLSPDRASASNRTSSNSPGPTQRRSPVKVRVQIEE